jgi:hypothetical protein
MFGSGIQNLPMLQGISRVGELLKNDPETDKWKNFASGTLSTSLALFFPSFGAFKSKGDAENIQNVKDIITSAEDNNLATAAGQIGLGVTQKLSRNVPVDMDYNPYYEAAIGVMGEDLSNRVTLYEPKSIAAYIEAMFNPFQVRTWKPTLKENEDKDRYQQAMFINANILNFAYMFQQITGRTYEYEYEGKKADLYSVISQPVKNEFRYDGTNIRTVYSSSNMPNAFDYYLPNEIYRDEMKRRGDKVFLATRKFLTEFEKSAAVIKDAIYRDDEETAKREIVSAIESYNSTVKLATDTWLTDYKTNREKFIVMKLYREGKLPKEALQKVGIVE